MDFFAILDYIGVAIQNAVVFILQVITSLVKTLNDIFSAIWQGLVDFAEFLHGIFDSLRDFLDDVWNEVIVPGFEKLQQIYDDVTTWLQDFLDPLIEFLQRVHDLFYKYVYPWIKRAENILSTIRVILALFRILGAKWAAKLDADIQRIQGYLTDALQQIVGTLNGVSTWLAIAMDPAGIMRREFFKGSLFSSLPALRSAMNLGQDRPFTASEAENNAEDKNLARGGAAILTRNADGSVTLSNASQRIADSASDAVHYYAQE